MAKKKILAVDSRVLSLELEKSRIEREKARIVLNKGLLLYFVFLIVGIVGFAFDFIDSMLLNILVICGIVILIASTIPYLIIFHREEEKIKTRLSELATEAKQK